jgi:hypothetical protein
MKLIFFTVFIPFLVQAQKEVVIDLYDRSIKIVTTLSKDEIRTLEANYIKGGKYMLIERDSGLTLYHHIDVNRGSITDTFSYTETTIIENNNTVCAFTRFHSDIYELNKLLVGKSWEEKDSILNVAMYEKYEAKFTCKYKIISYKTTPIQYYRGKYPFVDVYQTNYNLYHDRRTYTSEIARVFVIGNILYCISAQSNFGKPSRSAFRSRKAVCCDFKRLVENVEIIEKEPISLPKNNN